MPDEFAYIERIRFMLSLLDEPHARDDLRRACVLCADTVQNGGLIHVFGCGHSHSAAEEAFYRAGGLAPVNAILIDCFMLLAGGLPGLLERTSGIGVSIVSTEPINFGDVVFIVSNSGINSVPVELAVEARKRGAHTVAITSFEHSAAVQSRVPDGSKLSDVVNIAIDTHAPLGDAAIELADGTHVGGVSSVMNLTIIQTIMSECCRILVSRGIRPPVFKSGNLEDTIEWNRELTDSLQGQIPRLAT